MRLEIKKKKIGRFLVNLVADPSYQTVVPVLQSTTGVKLTKPSAILEEFGQYYSSLFDKAPSFSPQALLTDRSFHVYPVSRGAGLEIESVICSFPNNKTPGLDGPSWTMVQGARSSIGSQTPNKYFPLVYNLWNCHLRCTRLTWWCFLSWVKIP